ncbi:MAG: deaminase, partial [Verrucomicrobiota bacterium]
MNLRETPPTARMAAMSADPFMRLALRLARRGYGRTAPNPVVGAVLVKGGKVIGRGWHRQAGGPHAEIEALRDAQKRGHNPRGATLFVTLEPCCTHGRTPPCTEAIIAARIKRVVGGATDPNPNHAGKGFKILRKAGITVDGWGEHPRKPLKSATPGSRGRSPHRQLADECVKVNEAFNHWIVNRTPFVTVKAAMTLDGKIATANRAVHHFSSPRDLTHLYELRATANAVMCGARTVEISQSVLDGGGEKFQRHRRGLGLAENALRIVVSGSGSLDPD